MASEINQFGEILSSVKDLQTTKELNRAISIFPRLFKNLFTRAEVWCLQREYRVLETAKLLEGKLKTMASDQIIDPPIYVAIPALQAMSYSYDSIELRDMYANLLAKSMNIDTSNLVHPSFVEIIKQMSPFDAYALSEITKNESIAFISIWKMRTQRDGDLLFRYYSKLAFTLDIPELSAVSLINLNRLGLIHLDESIQDSNSKNYTELTESIFVKSIINKNTEEKVLKLHNNKIVFLEGLISITPFGDSFTRICLSDLS